MLAAVFTLLLALILLRVPIGFSMLLAGFIGIASITGVDPAFKLVGQVVYATGLDYSWVVLPLFILMGNLISQAGFAADLYRASNSFLGHFRGGLAMATVVACGGLSAVSGSSLATAATMSKIAMPTMRAYGYSDRLSAASIAAGGTLGILIPPSIVMMIYGVLTETDIGKLFIAGVLPGIVGILGYIAAVWAVTRRHPELGPPGERMRMRGRFAMLKSVWPVLALFAFIIGGIYAGVFTPTEAAGMGVTGALVLGFVTGTLRLSALPAIFVESGRTTAMLFIVIFGSLVLGNYANLAGVTTYLNDFVAKYSITGMQLMLLFVVVCFILGAIVESLSMILLTIPIFFPLFKAQGVDAIWFGIIVVVVTEISFIVPPLGLNLFVLKSTVPDLDTRLLYRGIMPFMYADFVRLALLIWLPAISLFLPNLMIK